MSLVPRNSMYRILRYHLKYRLGSLQGLLEQLRFSPTLKFWYSFAVYMQNYNRRPKDASFWTQKHQDNIYDGGLKRKGNELQCLTNMCEDKHFNVQKESSNCTKCNVKYLEGKIQINVKENKKIIRVANRRILRITICLLFTCSHT